MARTAAILVARLIFAGAFAMAAFFKFAGMGDTAGYIASVGLPFPLLLAWLAAIFEVALVLAFLTGAFFSEAALLAGLYVIVLAFLFHGPDRWEANQMEFGFFIDHFTFLAGLLYAAVHGPGETLALNRSLIGKRAAAA
jgi:putative oxidoreductase